MVYIRVAYGPKNKLHLDTGITSDMIYEGIFVERNIRIYACDRAIERAARVKISHSTV